MFLGFKSSLRSTRSAATVLAAAGFVAGVLAAGIFDTPQHNAATASALAPAQAALRNVPSGTAAGYPADVIRVLDGDTFEARVRVWPGLDITTKVRLRGIDAPERRARCVEERARAEASRDALAALLAQGRVGVSRVSLDKYGGRVIADASAGSTVSVAEALLAGGHVRRYGGGRREGWCAGRPS